MTGGGVRQRTESVILWDSSRDVSYFHCFTDLLFGSSVLILLSARPLTPARGILFQTYYCVARLSKTPAFRQSGRTRVHYRLNWSTPSSTK